MISRSRNNPREDPRAVDSYNSFRLVPIWQPRLAAGISSLLSDTKWSGNQKKLFIQLLQLHAHLCGIPVFHALSLRNYSLLRDTIT